MLLHLSSHNATLYQRKKASELKWWKHNIVDLFSEVHWKRGEFWENFLVPRFELKSRLKKRPHCRMAIPEKQQAWVYDEYGPKENLRKTEIEVEKPTATQVLVKVHAAALNPIDSKRRGGFIKEHETIKPPTVPGYDLAGVVVQVGSNVTQFKVGDRVYGDVSENPRQPKKIGTIAQYCAVEERLLDVIPERLSFVEAASLPLALLTGYQALEKAGLKEGGTILILGGGGGVGTLAVQLARHVFKASVVATTASAPKVELLKSLGATAVIDYHKEPLSEHPTKYDVVFDTLGNGEGRLVVKENGFAISVAVRQPQPPEIRYFLTSRGSDLKKLNPFFQDGTLKPLVDSTGPYKFDDVVEAFGYLETRRATGKVVIAVQ